MMDHYFDKLLQIAAFEPTVVSNDYLTNEQKKRVEPLIKICLEWGRSGVVPEKLILSYDKTSNPAKPKKRKLLRKQVIRKRVLNSILQLRAKLKRQPKA
jgi:hypothetical protein